MFSELTIGRCKFVRAEVVRRGGVVGGPEQQVRARRQREGQRSSNDRELCVAPGTHLDPGTDRDEQEGASAHLASGVEPRVRGVEREQPDPGEQRDERTEQGQ